MMNKTESEAILIGGAFLLAPVIACLAAWPFFGFKNALWPIGIGTVAGMAVYIGACLLHRHLYRESNDDEKAGEATDDKEKANGSSTKTPPDQESVSEE